jgi:hypothetical protein
MVWEIKRPPMALALPDYTSPCGFGKPRLGAAKFDFRPKN